METQESRDRESDPASLPYARMKRPGAAPPLGARLLLEALCAAGAVFAGLEWYRFILECRYRPAIPSTRFPAVGLMVGFVAFASGLAVMMFKPRTSYVWVIVCLAVGSVAIVLSSGVVWE
jgi:hypothetical protein